MHLWVTHHASVSLQLWCSPTTSMLVQRPCSAGTSTTQRPIPSSPRGSGVSYSPPPNHTHTHTHGLLDCAKNHKIIIIYLFYCVFGITANMMRLEKMFIRWARRCKTKMRASMLNRMRHNLYLVFIIVGSQNIQVLIFFVHIFWTDNRRPLATIDR